MPAKNNHYRNSILLKLANTNNYISIPELVDFTTSEYWRGDRGLDFETIDNILKEKDISKLLTLQSIDKLTKTGGIRKTKTYKLRDDFNTFLELICYIDDIYFDSLMCTNYYKKFEPGLKNRIDLDEDLNLNARDYISIAHFYDDSKDVYNNLKDINFMGLKEIAKKIQRQEELTETFLRQQSIPHGSAPGQVPYPNKWMFTLPCIMD